MADSSVATDACPRCQGRGWIIADDGGAGMARPCDCRREGLGERLLAAAGIPERYRRCRLANFQVAHQDPAARDQLTQALAISRTYADEFLTTEGGFTHSGLIYVGPAGAGKTHLAAAVLIELIERYRVRGRFVEFTSLVHQIQSTFEPSSPGSKSGILDPVVEAEVLVLDELGAAKPTAWVQDLLYLIINNRYTQRRPTLFTTNYSLDVPAAGPTEPKLDSMPAAPGAGPLAHRLPATLVSRLYEMARPVSLEAVPDFRREVKRAIAHHR